MPEIRLNPSNAALQLSLHHVLINVTFLCRGILGRDHSLPSGSQLAVNYILVVLDLILIHSPISSPPILLERSLHVFGYVY